MISKKMLLGGLGTILATTTIAAIVTASVTYSIEKKLNNRTTYLSDTILVEGDVSKFRKNQAEEYLNKLQKENKIYEWDVKNKNNNLWGDIVSGFDTFFTNSKGNWEKDKENLPSIFFDSSLVKLVPISEGSDKYYYEIEFAYVRYYWDDATKFKQTTNFEKIKIYHKDDLTEEEINKSSNILLGYDAYKGYEKQQIKEKI